MSCQDNQGIPTDQTAHTLNDNRHGLVVSAVVAQADGYAEREAAKAMFMFDDARQALPSDEPITITLGADKGYAPRNSSTHCRR